MAYCGGIPCPRRYHRCYRKSKTAVSCETAVLVRMTQQKLTTIANSLLGGRQTSRTLMRSYWHDARSGCQVSRHEKSQGIAFPLMHEHACRGSGGIPPWEKQKRTSKNAAVSDKTAAFLVSPYEKSITPYRRYSGRHHRDVRGSARLHGGDCRFRRP